jgi:hypothetical protein
MSLNFLSHGTAAAQHLQTARSWNLPVSRYSRQNSSSTEASNSARISNSPRPESQNSGVVDVSLGLEPSKGG